jgi:hypothetical protein
VDRIQWLLTLVKVNTDNLSGSIRSGNSLNTWTTISLSIRALRSGPTYPWYSSRASIPAAANTRVTDRQARPHSAAGGTDVSQVSRSAVISLCKVCPRYLSADSHLYFSRDETGCCDLMRLVLPASQVTGQSSVADRHITTFFVYLKTFYIVIK